MPASYSSTPVPPVHVRVYRPADQLIVARLFTQGLLAGQIDPYDTGSDIDHVNEAYLKHPHDRFWVAEIQQEVKGMIGVAHDEAHVAIIRRLRVERALQSSPIADVLIETALQHCRHCGYLKVVLDTRFERDAALDLFTRFGFRHTRTRSSHGKELLEFYADLYRPSKPGE